jgi:hypothetical protein
MGVKWFGIDEYFRYLDDFVAEIEERSTAHSFTSARKMVQFGLQNMSDFRIGLITGRSRALFKTGLKGTTALAGYISWEEGVEFYPHYLNNGTRRMIAKPYFDLAFEMVEPFFIEGMERVLKQAARSGL